MENYIIKELKNVQVLKFNIPNKNGRIYTSDNINLEDKIIQEKLIHKSFIGTIDTTNSYDTTTKTMDISKLSHIITALYKHEDGLYADIDILDTIEGNRLKTILEKSDKGGFRTVGNGNLKCDITTYHNIVTDYTLDTICFFIDPA